ncbi:MAG: potassium transporter KtrB [Ruminococcaceae bacterium]|nr:potassium transporter KtrB [Oscillospiraceae bacterium]
MKKRFKFTTTHMILLSFLFVIFIGSFLLSLPFATKSGESVSYIDALFTATTATCVTGLVTLPTVTTWSLFGQIVILILIQIGGLGIITVTAGIMSAMHRKIGMKDSRLLQDAFNLNTLSGLGEFVKKVIAGTLIVEGIGALLYMTVFIPEFGFKGIWISVFNSVSAFCNAGVDIIAENSLAKYIVNPIINIVTCLLIIIGGIGYIVWWDLLRVIKSVPKLKFAAFKKLTLHTKIVLSATAVFIFGGAAAIFVFEFNNPLTIGTYSIFDKIQASLFQSVTTRTAGFFTIPQENLTNASAILCLLLMFIGGSPVGTAGGVKTVTFAVLFATAVSAIQNKNEVTLFERNLSVQIARKAVAVTGMSFIIMLTSTLLLSAVTDASALDILYETVSATATVGLTRSLTPLLNVWGKIIIISTMYFGRIGPISLAVAFNLKKATSNNIKNPTEEISVG